MREALLIFDCDGVLVDSESFSHGVLQQMLAEMGVALSFDATVERFIGTSLPVCLARVGALLGGTLPENFAARFAWARRRGTAPWSRTCPTAVPQPRRPACAPSALWR
jgi:beta-phosphoglucomutase-like phosphatase (HAD superfamily)